MSQSIRLVSQSVSQSQQSYKVQVNQIQMFLSLSELLSIGVEKSDVCHGLVPKNMQVRLLRNDVYFRSRIRSVV